jgi:hypothetical protein
MVVKDIFICHAWRFHEEWCKCCSFFDSLPPPFQWRNFSLPWHDPAYNANSEAGGKFVRKFLEKQIQPVNYFILLETIYNIKSATSWVTLEIEFARRYKKPIILFRDPKKEIGDCLLDVSCFDVISVMSKDSFLDTIKKIEEQ